MTESAHYFIHLNLGTEGELPDPRYIVDVLMYRLRCHNEDLVENPDSVPEPEREGESDQVLIPLSMRISEPLAAYEDGVIVLNDGKTWTSIEGCRIGEIAAVDPYDEPTGRTLFKF